MEMWFYNNTSDERYLNKNITEIPNTRQSNVYLKDGTNIIDPIIITDFVPLQTFNYAWLSEFNRYYYVREIEFNEGRYHITMHVDVLMSFKDSIKKQRAIIKRGSSYPNLYMSDDEFKTQQYTCDRYIPFEGANAFDYDIQNYILAVMGTGGDTPESDDVNVHISSMPTVDVTGSIGTHDDTPPTPPINQEEPPNNL